jgi:hypothetical protein
MPRKKLPHYQVLRVEEHHAKDKTLIALQERVLDDLREPPNSPDGTFIRWLSELYLPKRKRGVKFRVTYTQVFQKEI